MERSQHLDSLQLHPKVYNMAHRRSQTEAQCEDYMHHKIIQKEQAENRSELHSDRIMDKSLKKPRSHHKKTNSNKQFSRNINSVVHRNFYLNHIKIHSENTKNKYHELISKTSGNGDGKNIGNGHDNSYNSSKSNKYNWSNQLKIKLEKQKEQQYEISAETKDREIRNKVKLMTAPTYTHFDDKKQRFEKIKLTPSFKNTPKVSMLKKNKGILVKAKHRGTTRNHNSQSTNLIKKSIEEDQRNSLINLGSWRKEADIISKCLIELIEYGTAQKKLNKGIQNYFENKKKGYLELFMKKINKKKSLADEIYYEAYRNPQKILDNIIKKLDHFSDKDIYFLGLEISQYRHFLEAKIANKHHLQLLQISERMKKNICSYEMREFAKDLISRSSPSTEILSFYNDLENIESNYGQLNLLSVKNRKRFEYINDNEAGMREFLV